LKVAAEVVKPLDVEPGSKDTPVHSENMTIAAVARTLFGVEHAEKRVHVDSNGWHLLGSG
jgi:hypothetical protein